MDPTRVRTQSEIVDETLAPPVVAERVVAPVAGQAVVAEPVVAEPVVVERAAAASQYDTVQTSRQISAPAVVTGVVGVALLVMGLIATLRAGFSGPLNEPVVQVLGFAHTATLGLVEIFAGIVLLLAALSGSRAFQVFGGVMLGVFGFVAAAEPAKLQEQLAIEKSFGIVLVIAGAVIVLAAALIPNYARYSERSARARV